jgi:hypothetical protein
MTTVPTLVHQGMNEHGGCIMCGVIPEMVMAKIDALEAENARLLWRVQSAEYWKAEHLAGNKVIEQLRSALEHIATSCEVDTLTAAIECAKEALKEKL